ncbi:hypothetical protein F7725_004260 [Dissostichus mawsoni]|uniref:Calx-beta domain-containing protein n=1 Tax=Dissostichus mawsoni TaxID=36200 RepID=A0A7J5XI72_DISMA|nr:hypothetical protein F7725_004260 [Dissostichus mawsoni]
MGSRGLTLAWTWLPVLLLGLTCSSHSSLVKVSKGLKVKRGQSAFLQDGDLQFHIPRQKDACKVEVVLNEPITQRVGTLMPQVFDCHYLADEVKYVHNGCPLLKEDDVKLRLYRFTETETYMEVFSLHVDIIEPDCSIIKLGPKFLEVPEFYSLSDAVDGNVVSFHYEKRSSLECTVHMSNHDTHLPAHGQLVTGEPERATVRGDEPESFINLRQQLENKARAMCKSEDCLKGLKLVKFAKIPCDDFLMMGLRYQHIDPPSPDVDYIAIRLDLKDLRSGSIYQPPKPSFMSMFILEVDQFILTPLSTATLDSEDEETPQQLLVFNITKPPVDGFITHLSDHTRPISSFTWLDLNDMLIGYQPPNSSHTQRRNYEVELEVHDFFFEKSPSMTVHMSVRNADTNAPRVSWNMGLSLLEGQSRPIMWEQFQIVDNDNINAVRIITVDGLQHGRLTVRAGVVRYHHDDSDSTKDFIIFRITDGLHQTRHKFPIKILPKDDSPPFLITNMLLEVSEGQLALLRGSTLQASDMDSSDDYILFNITRPPQAGEVMKMPPTGLTGYPVSHFLQKDLSQSMVYYRHLGNEVFDDSFEVVVMVHIEPVPDQPPKEVPGSSRCLVIKETEVVHITRQQLHFVDQESPDSELTFTVTTPPFFTGPHSSPDAGRLFLVDSIPKFSKDSNAPVLRLFTQHAVNFMKVAYMPPVMDIGPYPQYVQFVLSVTNHLGKTVTGICFNITVVPVDNQPPQVITNPLTVDEGGGGWIGPEHLRLSDVDSLEEALQVVLQRDPQHGALQLGGLPLKPGSAFTVQHVKSLKVRYKHDSSETLEDNIEFTATDGTNSVSVVLQVKVMPINDEVPVLVAGLKPVLSCAEGQEVVITAEYIYAADADSDNSGLAFLIARQPYHGVVLRSSVVVDRFLQADITAGVISYRHTGLEIGLTPRHDTITFVVSDGETETSHPCCAAEPPPMTRDLPQLRPSLPVYDLKASDVDTVLDQLVLSLISPPSLATLKMSCLVLALRKATQDKHRHQRMEPTADQFLLCISDGKHSSAHVPFYIIINPTNDEIPQFVARNITVSMDLMYMHDDSENMEDSFTLQLTDGRHQLQRRVVVMVLPINDEEPRVVRVTLLAQDEDTPPSEVLYMLESVPTQGLLQLKEGEDWETLTAVRNCSQEMVDMNLLRYVHTGLHGAQTQDFFVFYLLDGKNQSPLQHFHISVSRGDRVVLTTDVLLATDGTEKPEELLFIITHPPAHGHMEYIKHPGLAISTFSQMDVAANLVAYVHDNRATTPRESFQFVVSNGRTSRNGSFEMLVEMVDRILPSLSSNKGLSAPQGSSMILGPDCLILSDPDTPPRALTFELVQAPQYGRLLLAGSTLTAGSNFTQRDIQELEIKPLDNTYPEVVKLIPLWKAEPLGDGRHGIFVSSRELKAQDRDSRDDEMIFSITELNKRTIAYIINPHRESLTDSLEFTVSDPLGNTGPPHILKFSWSTVELSQPEYSVSEEHRTLSLDIIRKGNLAESSYITVEVKEVSATAGTDFLISPSSLIQFDPGVSKRRWQTEIIQDHLEEAVEIFEVLLVSPEGSVIGSINKAQVQIRDSGRVEDFPKTLTKLCQNLKRHRTDLAEPGSKGSCSGRKRDWIRHLPPAWIHSSGETAPGNRINHLGPWRQFIQACCRSAKKKLKVLDNPKSITPSSVFHNGTDTVYTGRKADIRVVSRGAQQQGPAVFTKSKSDPKTKISKPQKTAAEGPVTDNSVPKPCVPELIGLLHFNQTTNQLFHCNGVSWKPWAPNDQMMSGQKCPQGWTFHSGHCYSLSTEHKVTWSAANRACRERYCMIRKAEGAGSGRGRAAQLHQLEKDPPSVQNEGKQKVHPGGEKGKVADQGLQDGQRSSLRVLQKNLILQCVQHHSHEPLWCFRRGRTDPRDI